MVSLAAARMTAAGLVSEHVSVWSFVRLELKLYTLLEA